MEYLVLSEDCLDEFTVNEDMTVTLEGDDEQDVVAISLQYVEQVCTLTRKDKHTYEFLIKPTIPIKELQRLMFYAVKSGADKCWFHLEFNLNFITFK